MKISETLECEVRSDVGLQISSALSRNADYKISTTESVLVL